MGESSVKLHILKSGLLTLVQDMGRIGHQAFGLPVGGVLDRRAARQANHLLGQSEDVPVLEITLQGPEIRFDGDLQIAITGADLSPAIDGEPVERYQTINVFKGQILSFSRSRSGCRAYLAIRGKWQIQDWLGSSSALQIGKGYWPPASRLEKGMEFSILPGSPVEALTIPAKEQAFHAHQITVRVTPGPEFSWFAETSIRYFTTHAFTVGPDSNRMGYRLREKLPDFQIGRELISSGIVPGTVQVLPSGCPVVLLADAQTSGGYPRIANVSSRDLDDLAQLVPGDKVRFMML